jgi:archaeosine synthase beta-subunit
LSTYPERTADRDNWIFARRPARVALNPRQPYAFFVEEERSSEGEIVPVATIFLTNRECPFRCVMCDLWRNTLTESVPIGAIPEQIEFALKRMSAARVVKLYNSGSFFDPRAIPVEDYEAIAALVQNFERVIVECHPAFVDEWCVAFRDLLTVRLEVAMGLETAHPGVLEKLNKRMTLDQFTAAADFLQRNDIDLRVFILVQPPFMKRDEAMNWTRRSLDVAFECGATAATLICTRGGNGAMEMLAANGEFTSPDLGVLEGSVEYGLRLQRGRVFTDLWDMKRGQECTCCFEARVERLHKMNLHQAILTAVACDACERQR